MSQENNEESDSDDFFDACQDFGSPSPINPNPSLPLVADDTSLLLETKTSDSSYNDGGSLSLEQLIKPDEQTVVATEDIEEIKVTDTVELVQKSETMPELEKIVPNNSTLENNEETVCQVFSKKSSEHGAGIVLNGPKEDVITLEKMYVTVEKQAAVTEEQTNAEVERSKMSNPLQDEETSTKAESKRVSPFQQPDLVASIKERPSDLPGVQSFTLGEVSAPVVHRQSPAHVHQPSPVRPKRPPPPRPKAPPKRPPPPRSASQTLMKSSYLSSVDDGLLTPNSTVDNITREFAAALSVENTKIEEETSKQVKHVSEFKTSPSITPSSVEKVVPQTSDVPKTTKSKESQPKRRSLARRLSGAGNNSQFDEDVPWSEVTKETILRIDSSPGLEILSTVIVRNLDTGQTMPLSVAAEQVSQCLNPLALQIMSRTKEFNCASVNPTEPKEAPPVKPLTPELPKALSIDDDTFSIGSDDITIGGEAVSGRGESSRKLRMKSKKFKQFIGKGARRVKEAAGSQVGKAVHKVKQSKAESTHSEALNVSSDEEMNDSMASSFVKTKSSSSNKDSPYFTRLKLVQDIAVHVGAVWSMKFSHCGRLLATAGQNNVIWVWVLKDYFAYFNDLRNKYDSKERGMVFATPPRNTMEQMKEEEDRRASRLSSEVGGTTYSGSDEPDDEEDAPFRSLPFSSYVGHTADVLDLAWSKNYFTLSSSMDKTVRLWHVSQKECLCCFQHIDFVTAIAFHPRDDRYFLSGSLDSKLRLWNIPEKKVALWNEVPPDSQSGSSSTGGGALITTVNFCENGKFAVCGTYDGRCLFYDTEHLKYHTQIHVRSSRRRHNKGHKITGIEPLTGEHKILVTSNDSRVRLYDLRDLSLTCKFKGLTNISSQIKASFSHDNKFIICGSEDKCVYIWKTNPPQDVTKLSSFRRDRNDAWESIRAHNAVVTCAIFAPHPHLMVRSGDRSETGSRTSFRTSLKKTSSASNLFIISADFNGVIKVFSTS